MRSLARSARIEAGEEGWLDVEQWAELRREHFVARRLDQGARAPDRAGAQHHSARRCAQRRAAGLSAGAEARRSSTRSRTEIHRLLKDEPRLTGVRVRELLEPLGLQAARRSSTITCARSGRCLRRRRTFQRTVYRPGRDLPVRPLGAARRDPGRTRPDAQGLGRHRLLGLLARGRRRAGLLQADRGPALAGIAGCL